LSIAYPFRINISLTTFVRKFDLLHQWFVKLTWPNKKAESQGNKVALPAAQSCLIRLISFEFYFLFFLVHPVDSKQLGNLIPPLILGYANFPFSPPAHLLFYSQFWQPSELYFQFGCSLARLRRNFHYLYFFHFTDYDLKPRCQCHSQSPAHFFRALIAAYQFRQRFANFSKKQRPAPQF